MCRAPQKILLTLLLLLPLPPLSNTYTQGDRNALHTLSMGLTQPPSKDGFAVSVEAPARWGPQEYTLEFNPPCLVR